MGFSPSLTGFIALSLGQDRIPGWWEHVREATYLGLARKRQRQESVRGETRDKVSVWGGNLLPP